jgi:cell division inhibitor SepF
MASAVKRMAVYLGLVEDGQDEAENIAPPKKIRAVESLPGVVSQPVVPDISEGVARITTLHPRSYNDARRIGEDFRLNIPVIINLTDLSEGDSRRIVDFAAGLTFGLHGRIERITTKVFLLTPANVDVGAAARAQAEEDGFFNQS